MKICLYQGTFNPPHLAHLQVADYVCKFFDINKIIFIPAANPPHKMLENNREMAFHRLNMTKIAVQNDNRFYVSDIEFQRTTPSYTCVTVRELYEKYQLTEKPYFIIGDDAFVKIKSWYETDILKNLLDFVVLPRDNDYDFETYENLKQQGYNYIRLSDMPKINISSTMVRKNINQNLSVEKLVTKEVAKYIYEHNLYKKVDR
jgi:nicotinate-nucleotide adenylyltransferase